MVAISELGPRIQASVALRRGATIGYAMTVLRGRFASIDCLEVRGAF